MEYEILTQDPEVYGLVESALLFSIRSLIPRIRVLDIQVHIFPFSVQERESLVYGYCTHVGDRDFIIELDEGQDPECMVRSVIHEMVHVEQIIRGRMVHGHTRGKGPTVHWDGLDYTGVPYSQCPWEIDAQEREEILYGEWRLTSQGQ